MQQRSIQHILRHGALLHFSSAQPAGFSRCSLAFSSKRQWQASKPFRRVVHALSKANMTQPQSQKITRQVQQLVPAQGQAQLTVLQWNILADGLAQHGDFTRAAPEILCWEYRAPLLLQEILESGADIVCLQEVNHFEDYFEPQLAQHGYCGVFLAKDCSPAQQYGYACDGCAIFYKAHRFSLVGKPVGLPFGGQTGPVNNQGSLHMLLSDHQTGLDVVAVCTHLKAKAGSANDTIRRLQAKQLLERISSAVKDACSRLDASGNGAGPHSNTNGAVPQPDVSSQMRPNGPVVVLCGDLNTVPESEACRLLRSHPLGLASVWDITQCSASSDAADGSSDYGTGSSSNGAGPAASTAAVATGAAAPPSSEKPVFTTWKYRPEGVVQRIIDYIWYTTDGRLRPVRCWRMLSEGDVGEAGLPSHRYASDHVAVCYCFDILPEPPT